MKWFVILFLPVVLVFCGCDEKAPVADDQGDSSYVSQREADVVGKSQQQAEEEVEQVIAEVDPGVAKELRARGGLPNFFAKIKAGKEITVGYFGGSITAHSGWRVQSFDWLEKRFPEAKFKMLSASVGGTGSLVGAFRADDDLVKHKPDLVFIEFSVNDGGDARRRTDDVLKALDGILHKLWKSDPATDVCFMYTIGEGNVQTVREGKYHQAAALHETVAEYYGLPSVYVGPNIVEQIDAGKMVFTGKIDENGYEDGKLVVTQDKTHPVIPTGHQIYADTVARSIDKMFAMDIKPVDRKLDKPMVADNWVAAKTIPVHGNAEFKGKWDNLTAENGPKGFRFGKRIYDWFPYLYQTETPGSSVTVRFKGTMIGIKGMIGPDSGIVSIQIDDQEPIRKCYFTVYNKSFAYVGVPMDPLADAEHTVTWTLSEEVPDKGKILASYWREGNDKDFLENPQRYKDNRFSVGQIILLGELIK